jgi:hypothetical protein
MRNGCGGNHWSRGSLLLAVWFAGCGDAGSVDEATPPAVNPAAASSENPTVPLTETAADDSTIESSEPVKTAPAPEPSPADFHFTRLQTEGVSDAEWEASHQALIELGGPAAATLRGGLASENPVVREWSSSLLALNVDAARESGDALVAALADPSPFVRGNAAAALLVLPDRVSAAVPTFVELLSADDAGLRESALLNLGGIGSEASEHVPLLLPLLDSPDSSVQVGVIELLGRIGAPAETAIPRLETLAADESDSARQSSAQSALVGIRGLESAE